MNTPHAAMGLLASAAPAETPAEASGKGGGHGGYLDLGPWLNEHLGPLFSTGEDQLGLGGIAVALLLIAGAFFMLIASIGVVRMPDLYARMHAASKAGTLGATCLILAVAVRFAGTPAGLGAAVEALLVLVFIFLTTPVAAHLIGRAGYYIDVPMSANTVRDDLGADLGGSDRATSRTAAGDLSLTGLDDDTESNGPDEDRRDQPERRRAIG